MIYLLQTDISYEEINLLFLIEQKIARTVVGKQTLY